MRYEKVGIDIGHDTIKMVAFRGKNEAHGIKAMQLYYAVGDPFSAEYFESLKKGITTFLKNNDIKRAAFSFTISMGDDVSINHLARLPLMKKKFLRKSIKFELEDAGISENLSDYQHKWEIIDTNKLENRYTILILGIKKDLINQISSIPNLKYKVENLELQPVTIGRMVEDTRLVIDFGQESTRIFYYKDGVPTLMRAISVGGVDIDKVITKRRGDLSREELMEIKQAISLYQPEPGENLDPLQEEIKEIVTDLTEEVRMYIRSLELEYEVYFDVISYIGGLANMAGLKDYISSELAIEFQPLSILNVPGDVKLSDVEKGIFFPAISSAMHKDLSYLSDLQFANLVKSQIDFSTVFIATICASLVLNFAAIDINRRYDNKLAELNNLSYTQGSIVESLKSDLEIYSDKAIEDQQYINTINSLSGHNSWLSDILYVLTMETPEEVVVKNMTLQEGDIVIKGYAKDYSSVAFIVMSLEKYGDVSIQSVDNTVEDEIYSQSKSLMNRGFTIRLNYGEDKRLIDDSIIKNNEIFKDKEIDEDSKDD